MKVVKTLAENIPCWVNIADSCSGIGLLIKGNVSNVSLGYAEAEDFDEWEIFNPDVLYYKVVYQNNNGEHTVMRKVTDSRICSFGSSDGFDFSVFDSIAEKYYEKYADDCIRDEEERSVEELRILKETGKPRYFKRIRNGVLDGVASAYTEEYKAKLRKWGYREISHDAYQDIMNRGNLYISYNNE